MQHQSTPGWYQDPSAAGQLRYHDGAAWTEHVAPGGPPAPAPQQSVVTNVVLASSAPPKSVGLAFLLTFLFGPFGLFYVSVGGAIAMVALNLVGGFLTFGVLNLILWPVEMVWGIVAAQNRNKAALASVQAHTAPQAPQAPQTHAMPMYGDPTPSASFPSAPASGTAAPSWSASGSHAAASAPSTPSAATPPPFLPEPPALPQQTGIEDPLAAFADASGMLPPPRQGHTDDRTV